MANTIVGGIVETKKIGLPIGVNGTHNNTFFDTQDNKIKLVITDTDALGNPVYAEEGYWISDIVDLQDKFVDYEKVFATLTTMNNDTISIETRVSNDNYTWDSWIAVAEDGAIQSETKRYIQIKINFFAGFVTDVFLISEFNNSADSVLFDGKVDTSNGLRLKREHKYDMTKDVTWANEGSLHKKSITRDEWTRIDKLNVVKKV